MLKKLSTVFCLILVILIVIYGGFTSYGFDKNKIILLLHIIILVPIRNLYFKLDGRFALV